MEYLRSVVVVIHVVALWTRRFERRPCFAERLDATHKCRCLPLPAEIHSAKQADGRGGIALARTGIAIGRTIFDLYAIQKVPGLTDRVGLHLEVSHVRAFERHQLPTD